MHNTLTCCLVLFLYDFQIIQIFKMFISCIFHVINEHSRVTKISVNITLIATYIPRYGTIIIYKIFLLQNNLMTIFLCQRVWISFGGMTSGTKLVELDPHPIVYQLNTLGKSLILPALQFLYLGKRITILHPRTDVKVS